MVDGVVAVVVVVVMANDEFHPFRSNDSHIRNQCLGFGSKAMTEYPMAILHKENQPIFIPTSITKTDDDDDDDEQ